MARVPQTKPRPKPTEAMVTVPRSLVEQTVAIIIQLPAAQVFTLVQLWQQAVPDMITQDNGNGQSQ